MDYTFVKKGEIRMEKKEIKEQTEIIEGLTRDNDNKLQDQRSTQENRQDLDQQQQVDVKPSQINIQKFDLTVNTKLENYSGKITGILYEDMPSKYLEEVELYLYFGSPNNFPVYKTNTDKEGMYIIEDLPPGYYSIVIRYKDNVLASAYNIKVLPGQSANQTLNISNGI